MLCLVDFSDSFFFFCSGAGKGESEAPGGGGRFLLKIPGGGGGSGRECVGGGARGGRVFARKLGVDFVFCWAGIPTKYRCDTPYCAILFKGG